MKKINRNTYEIVLCDCPKWETCRYGMIANWHKNYAVCGYCFLTEQPRGCSMTECDKYEPKRPSPRRDRMMNEKDCIDIDIGFQDDYDDDIEDKEIQDICSKYNVSNYEI